MMGGLTAIRYLAVISMYFDSQRFMCGKLWIPCGGKRCVEPQWGLVGDPWVNRGKYLKGTKVVLS